MISAASNDLTTRELHKKFTNDEEMAFFFSENLL
jgi:hypothetical protein